jgi:hypothetical protein
MPPASAFGYFEFCVVQDEDIAAGVDDEGPLRFAGRRTEVTERSAAPRRRRITDQVQAVITLAQHGRVPIDVEVKPNSSQNATDRSRSGAGNRSGERAPSQERTTRAASVNRRPETCISRRTRCLNACVSRRPPDLGFPAARQALKGRSGFDRRQ